MADIVPGALAGEALKRLIKEVERVRSFKTLFKKLVSTMEKLIPITQEIQSIQEKLDYNPGELKELNETMDRARVVIHKCQGGVFLLKKPLVSREIEGINKDMLKFFQIDLQLLQYRSILSLISNAPPPPSPSVSRDLCSVPKLDKVPVGFDWPLTEVKKKLLEEKVGCLLVSAPPGCGKTTLVTQLCHDAEIKGKFKQIFFNVVSNTPNFRSIVQNLLEHNGYTPRTFENDIQAKNGLRTLLEGLKQKGHMLLVLDDVWLSGAESLLEKFQMNIPEVKILVTSRFDLPDFDYTYNLKPLKVEDAKILLMEYASRPDHASTFEYEDLLQKILKRCSGFPLVIKVVGASLKNCSLRSWKGQVASWSQGDTVLDNPRPTVLDCLQPSFNALEPNLKQCFLDMGLFLEDQKIRASLIIDIWVELYDRSSMVCIKYLEDLATQSLLDLVPLGGNVLEDGFYNEFLVTQHDILRELAICQSKSEEHQERKRLNLEIREDKFPKWCLDLVKPISARLLSIYTDDAFTSKWVDMDCPNVEALVLNLSSLEYTLPSFISKMEKLKVLTIINHGVFPTRVSKFSCLNSLPNLKRIRFEKVSITLLDILQLRLNSLKKLSFIMCSFGEVYYDAIEEETDIFNAPSSLEEIEIDYCYDLEELPDWVLEVVSLKTLSITNCNKLSILPKAIDKLRKLETLRLSSCINLSELPETIEELSDLQCLDISHCLGLTKLPLEIGKLHKLKKISMSKCGKCVLPDSVRNLEDLEVKCDEETAFLWKRFEPEMKNLAVREEEIEHNLNLLRLF